MEKTPHQHHVNNGNEQMELPPGFRFHPTDEELITHYLTPKVLDISFCAIPIGEVDLNKCEPWDLPWKAKMGEKEWYFFCVRDRKYPTGLRTNRATEAGYWKATGKDKEIFRMKKLVGMKKTLVFYKGRAPRGLKSNWVMHEYRLHDNHNIQNTSKNEWVICRIFQKSSGGKKIPISGLARMESYADERPLVLPPLMDSSPQNGNSDTGTATGEASHVTCFSDRMEEDVSNSLNTCLIDNGCVLEQDQQSLLRILLGNDESNTNMKKGMSHEHDSWHGMDMSFMGSNHESMVMRRHFEDSIPLLSNSNGQGQQQGLDFFWKY